MSVVELAVEKVKRLDERHARQLLAWLEEHEDSGLAHPAPLGAKAMLGFARSLRSERRTTAEWMRELREGERD